jgi:hypothetical protein
MTTNKASYIDSSRTVARTSKNSLKIITTLIATTLLGVLGLSSFLTVHNAKKAEAFDITQWVMCDVLPEPAATAYQWAQTSDIPFLFRSKSAVTSGNDNVETGLNWILNLFGPGFKKINEDIIGHTLDGVTPNPNGGNNTNTPPTTSGEKNYNKGVKVNPYDRFGVAGLQYTAYIGEWKYMVIDACNSKTAPSDPKANLYYEQRLEPRSTWEDMTNSSDIRTIQFNKGLGSQLSTGINDVMANGIFNITKTMVVITIGLINFAFSDVTEVMGLNALIGGKGGIFDALYQGVFTPLIVIIFALTGLHIFYTGIVKRQYRNALNGLLRSLFMYMAAIVIAAAPTFWIGLPNKIAVVGQSLLLSAVNSELVNGNELCATDIGSYKTKIIDGNKKDEQDILTQASANMRSAVGCQYWQTFLVRPWAEGQFGTDWNKLWAKGKIASWAGSGASDIDNGNEEQVGTAEVPLGDGSVVNNWAIYQISTQTNVHVPMGHEGETSKYTSGVANDWWRIVDAMANYQEEQIETSVSGSGPNGGTTSVKYTVPKATTPVPYWDTWVGNNSFNRVWTASSSVVVAAVGLSVPFVFAVMSAIYAFGLALLMAFAPIMLLCGCWANRGWEIFKGYGELVLNTIGKRLATGILLAISIALTVSVIRMMDDTSLSWAQGMVILILLAVLLFRSRHKIIDSMASFRFASANLSNTANRIGERFTRGTSNLFKGSGRMATAMTAGAVGAKMAGGKITDGLRSGFKNEFTNMSYRSNNLFARNAVASYETAKTMGTDPSEEIFNGQSACASCGKLIRYEEDQNGTAIFQGGRTMDGNILCWECYSDGVDPEASEVIFRRAPESPRNQKMSPRQRDERKKLADAYDQRFKGSTQFRSNFTDNVTHELVNDYDNHLDVYGLTPSQRAKKLHVLSTSINYDIDSYMKTGKMPDIPEFLDAYLDRQTISYAWQEKQFDYIRASYAGAIISWYNDEIGRKIDTDLDTVLESIMHNQRKTNKGVTDADKTEETIEI